MKVKKLGNLKLAVSKKLGKTGLFLKQHSPEIKSAASTAGVIVGTALACRATLKSKEIIDDAKYEIDVVKDTLPEEDQGKELTKVYLITAGKVAREYALPAATIGASLGGFHSAGKEYRKRNASMAAAYAGLDQAYKAYREAVKEKFGEEKESDIYNNIKEITVTEIDDAGKKTKKKMEVIDGEEALKNPYSKFFDSSCAEWSDSAEYNMTYLLIQQARADDLLKSRGYLFLNEVYNLLGMMPTEAGQTVGWIYDEEHPVGDNYVDFGLYNTKDTKVRDFVNGYENVILLNFNPDGPIINRAGFPKF